MKGALELRDGSWIPIASIVRVYGHEDGPVRSPFAVKVDLSSSSPRTVSVHRSRVEQAIAMELVAGRCWG